LRYLAATAPPPSVYCAPWFLSPADCRRLIEEIDAGPLFAAPLREAGRGDVAVQQRRRADYLAGSSPAQAAVALRLTAITADLAAHFGVRLSGVQPPQFLSYPRGGYFRPHQDRSDDPGHAADIRSRRLTAVLFLNSQAPLPCAGGYCGGDLRLFRADNHPDPTLSIAGEAGLLVVFGAGVVHEVRPVTWGARRTVAAWYVDAG
jgi:predicted 2-oxoglutarate/Fe(II)-dependent dioxygenase YbiX